MRRRIRAGISVLLPSLACACALYHPVPITDTAMARALTVPSADIIARQAAHLSHPILAPITLDPRQPLSPQEAAVLAVLINPNLKAQRDRIGVSNAQLVVAGLLPNPQLNYGMDYTTAGPGITTPYGIGVSWDISSLVTHAVKRQAAQESLASVRLDVAWTEWQAAESAKAGVFDQVADARELKQAEEVERRLNENFRVIQGAYERHQQTILQLSAASTASGNAHATVLSLGQQLAHQKLVLLQALGLPSDAQVELRSDITLSSRLNLPTAEELLAGLEDRRLDLIALRRGYESQEQSVRAAILGQFPKLNLGVNRAKDNAGVYSVGFAAAIELPIFNRNQGAIALERATRQRLYDEYVSRVFQARSDIAVQLKDVAALTEQIAAAEAALPSLEQLVQTYHIAIERGYADVLNYYTAWNNLSQKQIELLKLKQQLEHARIALELAAGEDLSHASAVANSPTTPPHEGHPP